MKTAQPPLVGSTARTCTSMTVLFTGATVPREGGKTSCSGRGRRARVSHVEKGDKSSCMFRGINNCPICSRWRNDEKRLGPGGSKRHLQRRRLGNRLLFH